MGAHHPAPTKYLHKGENLLRIGEVKKVTSIICYIKTFGCSTEDTLDLICNCILKVVLNS